MATESNGFDEYRRPSHDGALRCVLCMGTQPDADHEWCLAANSLLCDDCCAALLHGDITRLFSVAANTGHIVTLDDLFRTCAVCPRAHLHARQHLLDITEATDGPAC